MLDNPFHEEIPPKVQYEPSLVQFEALVSNPITCCLAEEPKPYLATTSFQYAGVADFNDALLPYLIPIMAEIHHVTGSPSNATAMESSTQPIPKKGDAILPLL
ncbi:hypothetical protein WISP_86835 [Willisornis vidua]|uniref:Uncharacterized protein n=1 Tax=Willisornis vidua TaxID=1566151 RepID=A0ABQ9D2U8_9PASS|nr:hypothetical protein WISP_86835 [Willisornis vidua]